MQLSFHFTTLQLNLLCLTFLTGVLKKEMILFLIDVQYTSTTDHCTVAHMVVQAALGELDIFQKVLLLTESTAYMHEMEWGSHLYYTTVCISHALHMTITVPLQLFAHGFRTCMP